MLGVLCDLGGGIGAWIGGLGASLNVDHVIGNCIVKIVQ